MRESAIVVQKTDTVVKLMQAKGCSRDGLDNIRTLRAVFKVIDAVKGDTKTALTLLDDARRAGRKSVRGVRSPKLLRRGIRE